MGIGKWLVLSGLTLNIAGAFCTGWRGVASPSVVTRDGPTSELGTPLGRFAERWGWRLLGAGFLLQLVGTMLWV